ncbi:protein atonal homolog 7-like [Actinia tenebrosa]|uniref:Protein atonal homolog 7-like n=1 Tax=Actinia tenebrosa TaxID=6105 RepID=A0A6P8HNQ6_ACTTE|nr:protein atonal homolog 7-like [Actinia tenebrosa]
MNNQVLCPRSIEEDNFAKMYAEQATTFPWSLFQNTPSQKDEENHKTSKRSRTSVPQTVRRHRQLRRNARERERQGRLNSAFDVLRGVIPDYLSGKGPERKLTQIETLRLATHYIMALSEMLEEENQKPAAEYCECGLAFSSTRTIGQEN